MEQMILSSATIGVVLSMITYGFGVWLRAKAKKDFFNPLLVSIVLCILFLIVFRIDYQVFNNSARYLSYLLTPATVSLAIPLYRQLNLLKKNFKAIILSILAGSLASMGSVLALSLLFHFSHAQYVTMLPKSITTAIGMGVSEELGGIVTITVAVIIVTGILGNMMAVFLSRLFRIKSPVARGLMLGTASHAIGTAKAMQMGEIEGAMSSLAIVVSGLITVIGASFFAMIQF